MKYTRITDTEHPLFEQAWRLYKHSFPPQERRLLSTQRRIMNHPQYRFELVTDAGQLVGFILWWGFSDVRYIEHLATLPHLRGNGCGRRILDGFYAAADIPVLLEVEHPEDDISRRRIGFYERAGFHLNNGQPYSHPPYRKGGDYVPLMLMTRPGPLTKEGLARFLGEHHPVIHALVLNGGKK